MRKEQGQTGRGGEAALSMTEGEGLMDNQLLGQGSGQGADGLLTRVGMLPVLMKVAPGAAAVCGSASRPPPLVT